MSSLPRVDIVNINFLDWAGERPFNGGAERYVRDLARLCSRMGFEIRIVQNAHTAFTRDVDGLAVVGVAAADRIDFDELSAGMAATVDGAALVIASPLELAARLPHGIPVIGISHGIWWDDPAAPRDKDQRTVDRVAQALARCNATVAVDTNFINWTRAEHIAHPSPIAYVPNYVELERFIAPPRRFDGRLRVLFPRRLCTERGFAVLLETFATLLSERDDIDLCICGGGAPGEEIAAREFAARHPQHVTWVERATDDMPAEYAVSHIVVIPTLFAEGTSLACLEAMASGNVVVATNVGGLANLVVDGYNGLLVDTGVAPLLDAMRRLTGDRTLMANLAGRARAVSATFGRGRWEAAWAALITDTVDRDVREHLALPARVAATMGLAAADAAVEHGVALAGALDDARRMQVAAIHDADMGRRRLNEMAAEATAQAMRHEELIREHEREAVARDAIAGDRDRLAAERNALQAALSAAAAAANKAREANESATIALASARDRALAAGAAHALELASAQATGEALRAQVAEQQQALRAFADAQAASAERETALHMHATALATVITARDQAIAWLRDELRSALQAFAQRRMSLRMLAVDALYAINARMPLLRRVARAVLPQRLRALVFRHSYANTLAVRFAVPTATRQALPQLHGALPAASGPGSPQPTAVPALPMRAPAVATAAAVAPSADATYDVVCFGIIDWGARFQRPQHLMTRFAEAGHRVFYIVASMIPEAGTPYAITPVAPNIFQVGLAIEHAQDFYALAPTPANVSAMRASLDRLLRDHAVTTAVSIVELPYWTPLALDVRTDRRWPVVYDCMDEWEDFPNIGRPLLAQERTLVAEADLVTVTGSLLATKWEPHAKRCLTVRNGVDFAFFSAHCVPNAQLEGLKRPIVGYYGALADWVDFELVAAVARARPQWSFVLVGDVFVKDLAGLDELSNVLLTGRRAYAEMPQFLYQFDVCMIPFKLNDVTHAVDPVKFYEYLSAGKPVVSVPLAEMQIYADSAYFATGADAFVDAIEVALRENDPEQWRARIALARENDWLARHALLVDGIRDVHAKVSIVIVAYNNVAMTRACVESIYCNTAWPNFEVIVVDNASADATRAWLTFLSRSRPNAAVILNDDNLGFAAANNQGLAKATGDVIVLLNNDTLVPRGWLEPLLERLADPTIGLVGPVTNAVGNEAKVPVDYAHADAMPAFAARWMDGHRNDAFDIRMLAMFCVALRREVFERVGALDESYGIGMFEDDDYSRRVQAEGLRTVCVPASFVHHHGQASFKKLIATGEYDRLWKRNKAIYERKWGKWLPHVTERSTEPPVETLSTAVSCAGEQHTIDITAGENK